MKLGRFYSILLIAVGLLVAGGFLYFDRNNAISTVIRSYGTTGVLAAILTMAAVCVTPIPSEGLLIAYIKVYGVVLGLTYSWIAFVLSSIILFALSRRVGYKLVTSWVTADRVAVIDGWVARRGILGLVIVRLLPIPAFVTNVVIGLMPSVSLWTYMWTGAVTIIPYYTGVAFLAIGLSTLDFTGLVIGTPILLIIALIGHRLYRRSTSIRAEQHDTP